MTRWSLPGSGEQRAGAPATTASGERAIAAGRTIRQALSGDGSVAMYAENALTLPADAYALPESAPDLVNLPDRTALFVGRERELGLLDEAFREANGVVVQAVHGLGGIGKSTLAARWAAGRVGSYNPVWWITAETPADLDAGLADLAVALQPALRDVLSREALRERAVQWLASHEGWLLVLDNVSDPADVKPLLGRATGGRFLITTRRATGWHGIAEPLSLDVLELPEAVRLFGRIHGGAAGADVEALCGELGCLPLAVEQAAAYCAEAGITAGRYRELLSAYPEELFAQSAEGTDQGRTVARVWRVSLDRLAETPLAGRILGIIAWWAPDGIPRAYLESLGTPIEVTEAIRRLAAHSLIKVHEDDTISVHRLVQAVARGEGDGAPEAVALLLHERLDLRGLDVAMEWLIHVEALAACTDPDADTGEHAWLFTMAGSSYTNFGTDYQTTLHERALAAAERAYGPRDEHTLSMRTNLARSYSYSEDHGRAIQLLEQNLADLVHTFGPTDQRTFEARTSLVQVLTAADRVTEALALARENAEEAEQALGSGHSTVLAAWSAWAEALRHAVEEDADTSAADATRAIEELLVKVAEAEGEDNRIFDSLQWQLVWVCKAAGDIERAATLLESSVARRGRVYGETSGATLNSRRVLVLLLWKTTKDLPRARELAVSLIADWRHVFGESPEVQELREEYAPLLTPPQS